MGNMADYFDDAGMDSYLAHQNGECEWGCQYCVEEEEASEEREAGREFSDWPFDPPY